VAEEQGRSHPAEKEADMARRWATAMGALILAFGAPDPLLAATPTNPTFSKDVAPILFKNCVLCHRTGEIAPMSLLTYDEARPWAKAIKSKVLAREMPPWPADPRYGRKFKNDRRLTQPDIDTIVRWVDTGAPKGRDADMPPPPPFPTGWGHPKGIEPDYVIDAPPVDIPADGEVPMLNRYAAVPFAEDKFAEALDVAPGNRAVVHHTVTYMVTLPAGARVEDGKLVNPAAIGRAADADVDVEVRQALRRERPPVDRFSSLQDTSDDRWLADYVPGGGYEEYAPGFGNRIEAGPGKYIRFNLHYTTTGKPETDQSHLGIWRQKVPMTHERFYRRIGQTHVVEGRELIAQDDGQLAGPRGARGLFPNIPPHASNWEIVGITPVLEDITIYNFQPHMHLRGKDKTFMVVYPDGREEVLLSVPKYDFHWQLHYELEEPLQVPAGSKLMTIGHYDNSVNNRFNPAPDKEVFWGEQTWDEMFNGMISFSVDSQDLTRTATPQ
jgi:hypothetical protein